MEFLKKHWMKIAIIAVILIIIYFATKKSNESSYANSCPCGKGKNCSCKKVAGVNMVTAS